MSILENDNESPTVKAMKRQLDNVTERAAKMEALLLDVCEKYMMQVDGKFAGELKDIIAVIGALGAAVCVILAMSHRPGGKQ